MTDLILYFFTTIFYGVQGIPMMVTYPTTSMPMNMARYPIYVKNDEILAIPTKNGSFYNKFRKKPIETLKRNHYNGFKVVLVSSSARKIYSSKP